MPTRFLSVTLLLLALLSPRAASALTPDEIVLIVNSKVPESGELAAFYAAQRKIPPGRVVALDLPFPQEDVSPEIYDAQVVPKVREFLLKNGLEKKVTCLVTFWGVPLRIQHRQPTPDQNAEMAERDREMRRVEAELLTAVTTLEAAAREADPAFAPAAGDQPEQLAQRAEAAVTVVRGGLGKIAEHSRRDAAYDALIDTVRTLAGRGAAMQEASRPELLVHRPQPATREDAAKLQQQLQQAQRDLAQLQSTIAERASREKSLEIVRQNFGLLQYLQSLRAARASLESVESTAAFDSELSLLWLETYPKQRWIPNLLHHGVTARGNAPRVLMVMRIDGPTEAVARRIITDSIEAEREGLTGVVALDARGNHGNDAYGQYDQTIRRLADLLRAKTKLDVQLDDKPEVYRPGALSDVALYCGWYSLRNYVAGFEFRRGAVGFHIASSELVSLRAPDEKGWVANLLKDGAASSLGPVAEPYLHSFPRPDQFFPLLLTGELTLAEVYWRTNPLASWMNTCVGDPLYRPFAKNPPLKGDDLPPPLRKALTRPGGGAGATPAPGSSAPPH